MRDYPRLPRPGEIWLLVGKQGTGKSTWAKGAVAADPGAAVICADFADEWSAAGQLTRHVRAGPLATRADLLELELEPELLDERPLRLAVALHGTVEQRAKDLRDLLGKLKVSEPADREVTLIIEEVGVQAPLLAKEFAELAALARHAGLGLVLISQFASGIPHALRRQATLIAAFRQDSPLDIDALADVMGREQAERVRELARGECEIWRERAPGKPAHKRHTKEK